MPPKAKFTKKEIVDAALEIVRQQGLGGVTARELGRRLKSSACPVFTVFETMEEVNREILRAARELYRGYIDRGLSQKPAFRGVGMAYIAFAREEPRLFQLLFMRETAEPTDVGHILPLLDESYQRILDSVRIPHGLSEEGARWIYRHLWVYTHGIAALCATGVCTFSQEEIQTMMTEVFCGLLGQCREPGGKKKGSVNNDSD